MHHVIAAMSGQGQNVTASPLRVHVLYFPQPTNGKVLIHNYNYSVAEL